ncbi:MAG: Ig-like domain-containing protein [Opitutaceae bacterium]|tara:strand:+ start:309 stop:2198 length:1890 start_codon:yes stop_codon:yes gene_type:complete
MKFESTIRNGLSLRWPVIMLALVSAFAANTFAASPSGEDVIISTSPMEIDADGTGAHGHLTVAPEILSEETENVLIYTITVEPNHGRVGLAGGEDGADLFDTKSSLFGYFAYRAEETYDGTDSFTYTVHNETSGLTFQNVVVVAVTPPTPLELDSFAVEASHLVLLNVSSVALTTRPNTPVSQKVPSHEDFMRPDDRLDLAEPHVIYVLDDVTTAQHGTAKLDHATGELSYAPNPGFIGIDQFDYYTVDENNPQFGVENSIVVQVEPIRRMKQVKADRSNSREIDLVFVINNSKSMAPHQQRIAASLSRFRQLFDQRDLDYRIGVLTTDFMSTRAGWSRADQSYYKKVRSVQIDPAGNPVLDRRDRPKKTTKRVASNGNLVTLPVMPFPWVTPDTPDSIFAELVKVGTNGDSNRTAFTAVYNFVADYYQKQHTFLRPEATTIVVFFMDEEETRMATWEEKRDGSRQAKWIQNGKLPELIDGYNDRHPQTRQTLDGYLNYWVLRPFIIAKGNKRGKLEIEAVVSPDNISHRRAAELTGGTVLNIESEFSEDLAALGDRIAETVAVALDPVEPGASFYQKSLRVLVDGQEVPADPHNGYVYDQRSHSIRFVGAAKQQAFVALIDITYEEHL